MKIRTLLATCIAGGMLATTTVYADHPSPMGAGWANMPNDIHNTRLEDSNEEFMDLVQGGGGVDSVNRYDDDTSTAEVPASRAEAQTTTGASAAASMSRSVSRTSMRSSGGTMSRGGRR